MTAGTGDRPETVARPGFLASFEVRVAALMMPSADARDRYRHEFIAELYGMSRPHQVGHATRILLSAWPLRQAVTADARGRVAREATMTAPEAMAGTVREFRCRLNIHRWIWRSTEDGSRYRLCGRCGKEDFRVSDPADCAAAVPPGAF